MKNAPLRHCPRCRGSECDHVERRLADCLASIGTGVTNIDVIGRACWVASLRSVKRTAFIELKREHEILGNGQAMVLADMTGVLVTRSGQRFEQRAFLVREVGPRFTVATYQTDWQAPEVLALETTLDDIARIISAWLNQGNLLRRAA